jgi:type IV pilus biogenesis protein PilP
VVDAPNSFDSQLPPVPSAEEGSTNFLSSTAGRWIIGGVVLAVLLGIVGYFVWAYVLNGSGSSPSVAPGQKVVTPAGSSSPSAVNPVDTAPITEPQEKPLESTFTFRNVFAPTLKEQFPPAVSAADSSTGGSSTSGTSSVSVPADTLYLQSIQTENGRTTATFIWNGTTYVLKKGQSIPDSPWKVVSIGDSSVVMLFGDTEVTLSTGQGLNK